MFALKENSKNPDTGLKKEKAFFQPKLTVNQPNDKYEQEADAMADHVMRTKNPSTGQSTFFKSDTTALQRKCQHCEEEEKLHRKETSASEAQGSHQLDNYVSSLGSSGQPLPDGNRKFFEQRFGRDFSGVRIHTDTVAAKSAQSVNALAYTTGNNIVFDSGQYSPDSDSGKKLLAHELTHVVQQSHNNPPSVQREPAKPALEKTDVSLLLDDDPRAVAEAHSYAPIVIRATSSEDAKKQLIALGRPIGTMFVVSHSNRGGQVEITSGIGTLSWIKLSDFSKDFKGALPADKAPETIDFRGCKLGEAPAEMETFRQNISAQKAKGTNCWSIVATVTPLTAPDGSDITTEGQIPKGMEKQFNQALITQINGLKTDDGRNVKNCISGLKAGETADGNFAKIRQLYFKGGGNISAGWVSPEFNQNWQEGSICAKDMTETTSPCKIVITQAAAAPPPAKEEKK